MLKKYTNKTRELKPPRPHVFRRFSSPGLGRINFLAPLRSWRQWEEGGGGAGWPVHLGGFVLLALLLGLDSLIVTRVELK